MSSFPIIIGLPAWLIDETWWCYAFTITQKKGRRAFGSKPLLPQDLCRIHERIVLLQPLCDKSFLNSFFCSTNITPNTTSIKLRKFQLLIFLTEVGRNVTLLPFTTLSRWHIYKTLHTFFKSGVMIQKSAAWIWVCLEKAHVKSFETNSHII